MHRTLNLRPGVPRPVLDRVWGVRCDSRPHSVSIRTLDPIEYRLARSRRPPGGQIVTTAITTVLRHVVFCPARRTFLEIQMVGVFAPVTQLDKACWDDNKDHKKQEQHNDIGRVHNRLNSLFISTITQEPYRQ